MHADIDTAFIQEIRTMLWLCNEWNVFTSKPNLYSTRFNV